MTGTSGAARNWAWLEGRLFEVLGAWVPSVPEPGVKVMLRRHSLHHGRHALRWDPLAPRPPDPETPPRLGPVLDAMAAPGATAERLAGAYTVVLPAVVAAYRRAATGGRGPAGVADLLAEEEADLAEGERALGRLGADRAAGPHAASLARMLGECGGMESIERC